jgi:hypothetical protein
LGFQSATFFSLFKFGKMRYKLFEKRSKTLCL